MTMYLVKEYLLSTAVVSEVPQIRYNLQRHYQMIEFVCSAHPKVNPPDIHVFMAVEAQCNSSESGATENIKAVYSIIDKISGQPCGAQCTCTVESVFYF